MEPEEILISRMLLIHRVKGRSEETDGCYYKKRSERPCVRSRARALESSEAPRTPARKRHLSLSTECRGEISAPTKSEPIAIPSTARPRYPRAIGRSAARRYLRLGSGISFESNDPRTCNRTSTIDRLQLEALGTRVDRNVDIFLHHR